MIIPGALSIITYDSCTTLYLLGIIIIHERHEYVHHDFHKIFPRPKSAQNFPRCGRTRLTLAVTSTSRVAIASRCASRPSCQRQEKLHRVSLRLW
jgi:hypothetical protein